MAHIVADRIRDTTTTTGTGAVTVSGTPPATYKTFSARMTTSDTCAYFIAHRTADEWECGIGTYSASNTLTRTTVLSSSNSDAVVTFSAGTKDVVLTQVAARMFGNIANFTLDDAVNTGPSTILTLAHTTTGTPAPAMGTSLLFQAESATALRDIVQLTAYITDMTSGIDSAQLNVGVRVNSGGITGNLFSFYGNGFFWTAAGAGGYGGDSGGAIISGPGGRTQVGPSLTISSDDVRLERDGAALLAQRNGANAQTFRVYNTYTNSSNYERGVFDWNVTANVLTIGSEAGGTGTNRQMRLQVATAVSLTLNNPFNGDMMWAAGGTNVLHFDGNDVSQHGAPTLRNDGMWCWSSTSDPAATTDTALARNGAGVIEINSGTAGTYKNLRLATLWRAAPITKTADFTVGADEYSFINNKSGSACTVTLPTASSFPGREILITNYQAQTVISASSNVIPAIGGSAGTAILAATTGKWAKLVSNGTNWVIMAST